MRMSHAHEPRAAATEPSRIVDARPSLARRPRDRSIGSVQIAHDVEHNTRAPTTSDASRNHTRTARHAPPMDSDRTQHGGGRCAEWAPRLAGRGRGRRAMPAATSTTERHDQPAMAASWPLSRRPPATIARPAATRQRPPRPSRNRSATGRFCRWDSRRSPQISAGGDPSIVNSTWFVQG